MAGTSDSMESVRMNCSPLTGCLSPKRRRRRNHDHARDTKIHRSRESQVAGGDKGVHRDEVEEAFQTYFECVEREDKVEEEFLKEKLNKLKEVRK